MLLEQSAAFDGSHESGGLHAAFLISSIGCSLPICPVALTMGFVALSSGYAPQVRHGLLRMWVERSGYRPRNWRTGWCGGRSIVICGAVSHSNIAGMYTIVEIQEILRQVLHPELCHGGSSMESDIRFSREMFLLSANSRGHVHMTSLLWKSGFTRSMRPEGLPASSSSQSHLAISPIFLCSCSLPAVAVSELQMLATCWV